VATGMIGNPHRPKWTGMDRFTGTILHSIEYKNPEPWSGQRVLVVGVGNSGAEIAAELAESGAEVSISIRAGAHVMPLVLFGVPIQYWSLLLERLPRGIREGLARFSGTITRLRRGPPVLPVPSWSPLEKPPVIGFRLPEAIRQGKVTLRPDIQSFETGSVLFVGGERAAFDAVILATGFRASVGFIAEKFERDARGFPKSAGVRCTDLPCCWVMGHRYAAVGALANIRRDAALLAKELCP
jgi:cation diffusion facilitator CzcD-associated flavoprotein CzcO